jgi:hypothetical protein
MEQALAQCMGVSLEEYRAMVRPTGYQSRPPTRAEMKRASQISKKIGPQRQMQCSQTVATQQAGLQAAAMQQMAVQAQGRMAAPQPAGADGAATEAPGRQPALAGAPLAELTKGKTTIRDIDWVAGSAEVSPGASAALDQALRQLAGAMRSAGGRYRIDLYLDQRYDEAAARTYGSARLHLVQTSLAGALGDPALAPKLGKVKRDKDPRIEVVKE